MLKVDSEASSGVFTKAPGLVRWRLVLADFFDNKTSSPAPPQTRVSAQPGLPGLSQSEVPLLTEALGSPLASASRALAERFGRSLLKRICSQAPLLQEASASSAPSEEEREGATELTKEGTKEEAKELTKEVAVPVDFPARCEALPVLAPPLIRLWKLKNASARGGASAPCVSEAVAAATLVKAGEEGSPAEGVCSRSDFFRDQVAPLLLRAARPASAVGEDASRKDAAEVLEASESALLQLPLDALAELLTVSPCARESRDSLGFWLSSRERPFWRRVFGRLLLRCVQAVDEELHALAPHLQRNREGEAAASQVESVLSDLYSEGLTLFEARLSRASPQELARLAARTPRLSQLPLSLFSTQGKADSSPSASASPSASMASQARVEEEAKQRRLFFLTAVVEETASRLGRALASSASEGSALEAIDRTDAPELLLLMLQLLSASGEEAWREVYSLLERKGCDARALGLCLQRLGEKLRELDARVFLSALVAFARLDVGREADSSFVGDGNFFSPFEDAALECEEEAPRARLLQGGESSSSLSSALALLLPGASREHSFFSDISANVSAAATAFRSTLHAAVQGQLARGAFLDKLKIFEVSSAVFSVCRSVGGVSLNAESLKFEMRRRCVQVAALFWSVERLGLASVAVCLPLLDK